MHDCVLFCNLTNKANDTPGDGTVPSHPFFLLRR